MLKGSGGGGGSKTRKAVEAKDSARSVEYLSAQEVWSEGPIYGLTTKDTDPERSVFFNETPISNSDGSKNFAAYEFESRVGTMDQSPFAIMGDETGGENQVGLELKTTVPWTFTSTNKTTDGLRVRISTPQLTLQNMENGDITGTSVEYAFQLAVDNGAYQEVGRFTINDKVTSEYVRSHYVELPARNINYSIRVVRITPDSTSSALQNKLFVKGFTEVVKVKLRNPMVAGIAWRINAEQFPSIPTVACDVKGRIIRVPTNYDPDTRAYTGIWDGTFKLAWTDCPPWILYDILTNSRYGLGDIIPEAWTNKWMLYKIARYCDELVPDGKGGMEPRFTANVYYDTADDAAAVITNLAAVFRGMMYAGNGEIVTTADMPEEPVYTYTYGNIKADGKFVYSGSSRAARHTVALVSWQDLSDFGRAKVEYIEDEEAIKRYGIQKIETTAFAANSQGQARRAGKAILTTERYETDMVTFPVGEDGVLVAPGKLVYIQDPMRSGGRYGGRIRMATATTISVDKLPQLAVGDVMIAPLPNGTVERRTVSAISGNVVSVSTPFSAIPVVQGVWAVETPETALQVFRVLDVTENSDGGFTVSALQHNASKYGHIEQDLKITVPQIAKPPVRVLLSPTNVILVPRDVADSNVTQTMLTGSWDAVNGATSYNVKYRFNNGAWIDAGDVNGTNIEIASVPKGTAEMIVTAQNAIAVSIPTSTGETVVPENSAPPGVVVELQENLGAETQARIQAIQEEVDNRVVAITQTLEQANAYALQKATEKLAIAQAAVDAANARINDVIGVADTWQQDIDYPKGDFVKYGSLLYQALRPNINKQPNLNPADWQQKGEYSSLGDMASATLSLATNTADELGTQTERIDGIIQTINDPDTGLSARATKTYVDQVKQRIDNVGGNRTVEQLATTVDQTALTLNDADTGLANTRTKATSALQRITDTGNGKTIEQVNEDLYALKQAYEGPNGISAYATKTQFDQLKQRVDVTPAGTSIEQMSTQLRDTVLAVNDVNTGLNSKASQSNFTLLQNRVNNTGTNNWSVEQLAQNYNASKLAIENASTGLSALNTAMSGVSQRLSVINVDNMVRNSSFLQGKDGWYEAWNQHGGTWTNVVTDGTGDGNRYVPAGVKAIKLQKVSQVLAAGSHYQWANTQRYPIKGGDYYIASAYANIWRANAYISLCFYDAAGTLLWGPSSPITPANGQPNQTFANALRLTTGAVQAPANAVEAVILLAAQGTGESDPNIFFWHPQVERAVAGQTQPSPYSIGGADLGPAIDNTIAKLDTLALEVRDPNTGLSGKASTSRMDSVEQRLNNTGAGRSFEQLVSQFDSTKNAMTDPNTGLVMGAYSLFGVKSSLVNNRQNLLRNPTGVDGLNGWWTNGSAITTTVNSWFGTAFYFPNNGADGRSVLYQRVPASEGMQMTFSAIPSYAPPANGYVYIGIVPKDASDTTIGNEVTQHMLPTDPNDKLLSVTHTMPAGTTSVIVVMVTFRGPGNYWRSAKLNIGSERGYYSDEGTIRNAIEQVNSIKADLTNPTTGLSAKASISTTNAIDLRLTTQEQNGAGVNKIPNTTFRYGSSGWVTTWNQSGLPFTVDARDGTGDGSNNYVPKGLFALFVGGIGTQAAGMQYNVATLRHFAVDPTKYYWAHCRANVWRATAHCGIAWYDASGNLINASISNGVTATSAFNATYANTAFMSTGRVQPPSNAITATFFVSNNGTGESSPHIFFFEPYFAEVKSTQTYPPPYTEGGNELAPQVNASINSITNLNLAVGGVNGAATNSTSLTYALGQMKGYQQNTLDINGYVTGSWSFNDGVRSGVKYRTDLFSIGSPQSGDDFTFANKMFTIKYANGNTAFRIGVAP